MAQIDAAHTISRSSCQNLSSLNFIWCAAVPSKVRLFAWKVCRETLPVLSRLLQHGICTDCSPQCGTLEENTLHVLLRRHFSRLVWALSGLPCRSLICEHSNAEF
ncbi:UNVERIFIED_CONTAM: hypothetical protein Sradi_5728700 [Sesamum radiatum]|uniref:Reverse transcriptase zinc-binding domain-containing protein n=1 Tax=Sesamum radiatum TaxID=300843 RepID=A0AAW2L332_SESRA